MAVWLRYILAENFFPHITIGCSSSCSCSEGELVDTFARLSPSWCGLDPGRQRPRRVAPLTDGCGARYPTNNSFGLQRLSRPLPLHWYARNASCQQMLPTHDDALGIRMDAAANFNPATKRHYSRVNPVSLVRNSFVYGDHAENIVY